LTFQAIATGVGRSEVLTRQEIHMPVGVAVIHSGEIVESGEINGAFTKPRHADTRRPPDAITSDRGHGFPASVNLL
jgi:ABC-type antimicrobial peptide transport system ATPase subunit